MIKELICISCPMGCHLKVDAENKTVTGNTCKRGEMYGINEVTNPVRVITSTVRVENGELPVVPVKTNNPIPKGLNFKCMEEINKTVVNAPVKIGDVVIKNVLGTGVDILATRNVKKI
jgi:CxxC motif-containing protein